eukprot:Skav228396  [mRNA]  locus=scaffold1911:110645:111884:+ [translate_table: standard]
MGWLAVVRDSVATAKSQKGGDPLQSLMSRQHVQATKLLVRKDCEARSATAENALLRDQLVQTTRRLHWDPGGWEMETQHQAFQAP